MSMQYFDFSSLIAKYTTDFTVITRNADGYDDRGVWQKGQETRTKTKGAIIAFKESKIFRSDGKITAKDKQLFMTKALPQALIGASVEHKGQRYMIESELENAEFTGVYSYLLRWVSAFDSV